VGQQDIQDNVSIDANQSKQEMIKKPHCLVYLWLSHKLSKNGCSNTISLKINYLGGKRMIG